MKKFFAMALSCALCLSMLAGCGDSAASSAPASESAAPTEAAAEAATETSVKDEVPAAEAGSTAEAATTEFTTVEDGKLHMATNAAFPPYEMVADDGTFEGIDVDIAGKIAEKLGLELVVERHGLWLHHHLCPDRQGRHRTGWPDRHRRAEAER